MSSRWMEIIMRSTLSGASRNLALAIADGSNQDGECVMRLTTIRAYAGGVSVTTAKRAVKQMEADGVISIERDPGGRVTLIQLHQMDGSKMDGSKMDGSKMDGSKMDGSKMDGSKMDGSKMDGSGEVVRIGKSQAESGLHDSDGAEAGVKDGENRARAPLVPPPSFPPQTPPYYPPTLNPPDIPERVEGEDARRGNQFGVAQVTMFDEAAEIAGRKKAQKAHPTEAEVVAYMVTLGLPENDGVYLHANWEAGGWTRNGKPIKDWKACARTWKAGGFLPSQKASTGRGGVVRGYRKIDYSKGF